MAEIIAENLSISKHHESLIERLNTSKGIWSAKLEELDGGKQVLAMNAEEQREFVFATINWLQAKGGNNYGYRVRHVLTRLLNQKLSFTEDEIISLLNWTIRQTNNYQRNLLEIIKIVESHLKQNLLAPDLQRKIVELTNAVSNDSGNTADKRKLAVRLRELAGIAETEIPLFAGEAWSDAAITDVENSDETLKKAWLEFFHICQKASGGSPNAKWLKEVRAAFEKIGFENFKSAVLRWFPLVDKPRTVQIETWSEWSPNPNLLINDVNADILKALVWLSAEREDKELSRALTALTVSAYRKVPKIGPRCVRVGNACVWALGAMPGSEAVGQLALLKLKIKFGTAQKGIEKALNAAAVRLNLPPEEIEEMSVPAYGLTEVGRGSETFGDFTAELVVTGTSAAEIRWTDANGKTLKTVPKFVKENHGEELKELTQAVKDIKKMLPAQRDRIDNFYLTEKRWKFAVWRERYLNHPLIGTLARRLIWQFRSGDKTTAGVWLEGDFYDSNKQQISNLDDDAEVELWHPLHASTAEVLQWRAILTKNEIQQPFKQAHREIYLLTDAERTTRIYSNRFAAHVIKQHQFNSLCAVRGWKTQLRLMVDDSYPPPSRRLPNWNLRAEFWVEAVGENYGEDTTESGTYLYLTTDQVRFYPINSDQHYAHAGGGGYSMIWNRGGEAVEPIALDQIPALVFSEIMRDVDLFVGVASVGNDPNWTNGRTEGNNYWYSYSFGDLTETAKTRREVLEKLVPRLKIADKCTIEDKFLIVRGSLRTYKIHLGSGNILMTPNDQYLCIVPSGSAEAFGGSKVFLPFEGDRTLAIILSKVFLLADDAKITDSTIVRQINL